jgi:hypothetical protein
LAAEGRLAQSRPSFVAAWSLADCATDLEAEPAGVVPEFVAQIAGYLGSPQVKEGLHALIDVGGGHSSTWRRSTSSCKAIGHLRHASPSSFLRFVRSEHTICATTAIPDSALIFRGTMRRPSNRPMTSVNEKMASVWTRSLQVDEAFVGQVVACIFGVIDGTRTNRREENPRSAAWREGLPIFVTGGGANCVLYRQAIEAGATGSEIASGAAAGFFDAFPAHRIEANLRQCTTNRGPAAG